MLALSVFYGYFIANSFKVFGQLYIESDSFLSLLAACASFCAALRFIFGFMMEKWSFRTCYSILICSNIVVCLVIYWAVRVKWLYLILCCLSMTLEGGHFTIMPIIYGRLFKN